MLKFFFHRESIFMRLILLSAFVLSLVYLVQNAFSLSHSSQTFWTFYFLFQAFFNGLIPFLPWYPQKRIKSPGITLHFQKTLSPLSYIWFLGSLSLILKLPNIIISFLAILLSPLTLVCSILIFFYLKDPQRQEVNILTGH